MATLATSRSSQRTRLDSGKGRFAPMNLTVMKLTKAALSLVLVSRAVAAWAPRSLQPRPPLSLSWSGTRRWVAATQFHASSSSSSYATEVVGAAQTDSFRLAFNEGGKALSPWHDVPLKNDDGTYNMVVEIPKMTKAKMEIATKEANNPIAQDIKKGKLRDYHGPIFWNYGCLPQTWEDPDAKHPELGYFGDNDPVDVVEIGSAALAMGSVKPVKALGVLAMIDDGELDWKVLAIARDDPLADEMHDIGDVPESIQAGVREWFRWYKTPDDKPLNAFGYDERYLGKAEAVAVIAETHEAWKKLKAGEIGAGKLWTGN